MYLNDEKTSAPITYRRQIQNVTVYSQMVIGRLDTFCKRIFLLPAR